MRTLRLAVPLAALLLAGLMATAGGDPLRGYPAAADRPADDATLVRRLTLDLAGRIPTPAEVRAFVASAEPAKRVQLVDQLLASPGFVRHQAAEFDALLMAGYRASLRDYLTRAFTQNKSW